MIHAPLPARPMAPIACALALLLASGATLALAQPAGLPSFDTGGAACDTIPLYAPDWAGHGDNFGRGLVKDGAYFMSGFYQLTGKGNRIYATFGGAMARKDRQQAKGITPGALVVLDADTLAHQRNITLPFLPHAIALQAGHDNAIVSYTRAGAFSLVDLGAGTQRCFKPDTQAGKDTWRNRYVTAGSDGSFYVSYYSGFGKGVRSTVAKFGADGRPAAGYQPAITAEHMALPAFHRDGRVYAGGQNVVAVDGRSGNVQRVFPDQPDWSVYTYGAGPGQTLLAANYRNDGTPNLVLVDPASQKTSALLTGSGGLETAFVPEGAQAFITNFHSGTVTVAELAADGKALTPGRFINLQIGGMPQGLHARRTARGTEVFITPKWDGDVIQKVTIAASVRGIDGIHRPGACSIIQFDMTDKSVSAARPCRILDERATYRHEAALATRTLSKMRADRQALEKQLPAARAALHRGWRGPTAAALQADVARLESELAYIDRMRPAVQKGQQRVQGLLKGLSRG